MEYEEKGHGKLVHLNIALEAIIHSNGSDSMVSSASKVTF
jgi:hypothetical protein